MTRGERWDLESETRVEEREGATLHAQDFGLNSEEKGEPLMVLGRGATRSESLFFFFL